jgi:hypothetical protein
MDFGVRISHVARSNLENFIFESCLFSTMDVACVRIGDSANAKHHVFRNCQFHNAPIAIEQLRGSFQCYDCDYGDLTDSAIVLTAPTEAILIQNVQSERCHRFLRAGATRFTHPVAIISGRFDIFSMATDGRYISFPCSCTFDHYAYENAASFRIAVGEGTSGSEGTSIVAIGNTYPTQDPYALIVGKAHFYSLANMVYVLDGGAVHTRMIPDLIGERVWFGVHTANQGGGLRLGEALSLSWNELYSPGSPYQLGAADCVVQAHAGGGAFNIQLPSAAIGTGTQGRLYIIKKVDVTNNPVTVLAASGETLEWPATSYVLAAPNKYVSLISNGQGNWMIVGSN